MTLESFITGWKADAFRTAEERDDVMWAQAMAELVPYRHERRTPAVIEEDSE